MTPFGFKVYEMVIFYVGTYVPACVRQGLQCAWYLIDIRNSNVPCTG